MKKEHRKKRLTPAEEQLQEGLRIIREHPLFGSLILNYTLVDKDVFERGTAARVSSRYRIYLNRHLLLAPEQWAYVIAHCQLHHGFGHFDGRSMPGHYLNEEEGEKTEKTWKPVIQKELWNLACDLSIAKFLADMKFGRPFSDCPLDRFPGSLQSELVIYQYLLQHEEAAAHFSYGTAAPHTMDMIGLDHPAMWYPVYPNPYMKRFARAVTSSVSHTIRQAGSLPSAEQKNTPAQQAAEWFVAHYPLLGALASAFRIVEDPDLCRRQEIRIAAIDMERGEIYVNPVCSFSNPELHFILAHEYLHAGLQHQNRCRGRDPYLWNIACDYVINAWLLEMGIGSMPEDGLLYDASLKDLSAETIYDLLIQDLRKSRRLQNLRGYDKGEFLNSPKASDAADSGKGVSLDEFCRNALAQGLEFVSAQKRGTIPAGLIEEIRALSMPPIPWDVKLARWFDTHFPRWNGIGPMPAPAGDRAPRRISQGPASSGRISPQTAGLSESSSTRPVPCPRRTSERRWEASPVMRLPETCPLPGWSSATPGPMTPDICRRTRSREESGSAGGAAPACSRVWIFWKGRPIFQSLDRSC